MQAAAIKTKAIVTRAVPYRESDMIVTLVSVELGRISASARGCLKPKAKLRYAAEPLNFGEYVLQGKEGKYVITECNQIESFSAVTTDIDRYYAACMALESLDKLSHEPQPALFMRTLATLSDLAYSEKDADVVVTEFLKNLIEINGFALDFAHCNVCKCDLEGEAYFSDRDGIVCKHCKGMTDIPIDGLSRAYISGESDGASHELRTKANIMLSNLVYQMLGVRIGAHYFTETI